jgi:nitrite reductase/ring-hydroxylating ferredoxin subunit
MTALLPLDAIGDGDARGVAVERDGRRHELIVVRRGGRVHCYINACPHLGTPLETFPDRFLDRAGKRLLCSTHGAQFLIETGYCVFGPCMGKSLAAVPVKVADGVIALAGQIPSPPEPQR